MDWPARLRNALDYLPRKVNDDCPHSSPALRST
jgi:hypothetical protein